MEVGADSFWSNRPFIISGPCSAETEEQVMGIARALHSDGRIQLFRAGIWKPRTRPGTFEGVGERGLAWLQRVKEELNFPVTVEVAKASHVELALKYGIDSLWIGARTTVNPFSVQELADVLRGVDIPVFVKNPINADQELWMGALERILSAGLSQVGLIHRGFSSPGRSEYRNPPNWQIPIEMKRRYPDTLLLCDPSHICGNRHMLQEVAQRSIDLGFSGLMLESHLNPDNAWSDAAQQVTPAGLRTILDALVWRKEENVSAGSDDELVQLRSMIDEMDAQILDIIGRRMEVADQIGEYKKNNNMTILQTRRWNEILQRGLSKGELLGLNKEFLLRYFNAIHMESIRHQNRVMNGSMELPESSK